MLYLRNEVRQIPVIGPISKLLMPSYNADTIRDFKNNVDVIERNSLVSFNNVNLRFEGNGYVLTDLTDEIDVSRYGYIPITMPSAKRRNLEEGKFHQVVVRFYGGKLQLYSTKKFSQRADQETSNLERIIGKYNPFPVPVRI